MTLTSRRFKSACAFFAVSAFLTACEAQAFMSSAEDSSEALFFDSPATVHNYKSDTDPHNIALAFAALTELEFIRVGDVLVSALIKGKHHPFSNIAHFTQDAFYRLPQIKPVKRIEQFGDALQLRQLSLSDARFFASIAEGQPGGGVSPIMQTRLYKILILVEDLIDDADRLIMFPVNKTVSALVDEPTRIETVGYAGDVLGYARGKVFYVLRVFNKTMVKAGSRLVFELEGVANHFLHSRRAHREGERLIYLKVPVELYLEHRSFFESRAVKHVMLGITDSQPRVTKTERFQAEPFIEKPHQPLIVAGVEESLGEILIATPMKSWRKPPRELMRYVITEDEAKEISNFRSK